MLLCVCFIVGVPLYVRIRIEDCRDYGGGIGDVVVAQSNGNKTKTGRDVFLQDAWPWFGWSEVALLVLVVLVGKEQVLRVGREV